MVEVPNHPFSHNMPYSSSSSLRVPRYVASRSPEKLPLSILTASTLLVPNVEHKELEGKYSPQAPFPLSPHKECIVRINESKSAGLIGHDRKEAYPLRSLTPRGDHSLFRWGEGNTAPLPSTSPLSTAPSSTTPLVVLLDAPPSVEGDSRQSSEFITPISQPLSDQDEGVVFEGDTHARAATWEWSRDDVRSNRRRGEPLHLHRHCHLQRTILIETINQFSDPHEESDGHAQRVIQLATTINESTLLRQRRRFFEIGSGVQF